jgi:hypothetical protein
MLIWDDMIHQPTYSGIFAYDAEEAAWYYGADLAEVEAALRIFEEQGKITRDKQYIYVPDFVKFQSYTPPSWRSVEIELDNLQARTGLASACAAHIAALRPSYKGLKQPFKEHTILYDTIPNNTIEEGDPMKGPVDTLLAIPKWKKKPKPAELLQYLRKLKEQFPGPNYQDEADKMAAWCTDNRKPPGKLRFRNWVERAQGDIPEAIKPGVLQSMNKEPVKREGFRLEGDTLYNGDDVIQPNEQQVADTKAMVQGLAGKFKREVE